MKVLMKTTMSGPDGSVAAGRIAIVTREQGQDLIAGGFAVAVAYGSDIETAAVAAPENTAMATGRPPFRHVGGGWYELADGTRVRGKKQAAKAGGPE